MELVKLSVSPFPTYLLVVVVKVVGNGEGAKRQRRQERQRQSERGEINVAKPVFGENCHVVPSPSEML